MWRTSISIRTLTGTEAKLFAATLGDFIEESNLSPDNDDSLGIKAFDNLTYSQKIAVLSEVGNALLREDVPCPELAAFNEAAVAAVYQHLRFCIQIDIDEPGFGSNWRELTAKACRECENEEVPHPSCEDLEEWEMCVEFLEDLILWDADYESGECFLDQYPEMNEFLREMFRVTDDYFTAIPSDPKDEEVGQMRQELIELCRQRENP
jgi:hypothetical protein